MMDGRDAGASGPRHTIAMPPPASCPSADDVSVWYAHTSALSSDPSAVIRAIAWLQPERAGPLRPLSVRRGPAHVPARPRDGARVWSAARSASRPARGAGARVRTGVRKSPRRTRSLRFNIAHSSGLVACALAHGRDVGVDVEDLKRRPVEPAVVSRYCSPFEAADVEAQGDALARPVPRVLDAERGVSESARDRHFRPSLRHQLLARSVRRRRWRSSTRSPAPTRAGSST